MLFVFGFFCFNLLLNVVRVVSSLRFTCLRIQSFLDNQQKKNIIWLSFFFFFFFP